MKTLSRRLCQWLIAIAVLVSGSAPAVAVPELAGSKPASAIPPGDIALRQSLHPLESVLRADGTFNLPAGFSASLDPHGWRMVNESGQPPRFVRTDEPEPDTPAAPGDEYWDNRFNVLGVSGYVRAIAVSGSDVYVGGLFSAVGGLAVNNIAKWSSITGTWSALGSGASGPVYAIAVSGSEVYVGGRFAAAGGVANTQNIAKWNGTNWSALGGGVNDTVEAIAISAGNVFIGGQFISASRVANTQHIAKWNGTSWSALGSGVSGPVQAIAASGTDVYVGGLFAAAGGVANTQNMGKWNGANWSALGSGVSGPVHAIAVSGTVVFAGGLFPAAGGAANTQNIARWNSSTNTWSALGSGVSGSVQAIAVSGAEVYVGGQFAAAGGVANTQNIGKWNGTIWSALGGGVRGPIYAIGIGVDGIYVGGLFAQTGNQAAQNFGLWHGSVAIPTNPDDVYWDNRFGGVNGLNGRVCAIAVSGSDVYVGGDFSMAGGVPASRIARWNSATNTWSALGSGITAPAGVGCDVRGIAISGDNVYVGGAFAHAGNVPGTYAIARWNTATQTWSALGGGTSGGSVSSVATDGETVYVAGFFPSVNTVVNPTLPSHYLTANSIAGWNGQWFALGNGAAVGVNSSAMSVEASGGNVYVGGGLFTMAGGVPANGIARWNGANWSALGGGVNGLVTDIAATGNIIYAGGTFTTAGGVLTNYVAQWDGTNWSSLGSGVSDFGGTFYQVNGIAALGDSAYVAGTFATADGRSANRIAKWDNGTRTWSALGSGLSSDGLAVALGPEGVYVGGQFTSAGGKPSNYIGLWHTALPHSGRISGRVLNGAAGVSGARVQVCRTGHGACYWQGLTDSQGNYAASGLPDGQYRVTAYPPASSGLLPGSIGPLTIADGGALFGQNIYLQVNQTPPPGTSISPIEGTEGGIPSVHWRKTLTLVTNGCPGGVASYQILQNGEVLHTGSMTESPPPPGRYVGTIEPLHPHNGYATIHMTIQCPDNSTQTIDFSIYIDPSGTVRTIYGTPVMSATVTLSYFDEVSGTFAIVPDGAAIMSPANRANPDLTDAEGHFGWDVVAGYYRVRAEKEGCVAPFDSAQTYVETDILVIPPPVTDLDLRLDCGEKLVYLPLVLR